jgi:hypothetical protein
VLQALQQLDLAYNPGLSGSLPEELGQCSLLTHIWLQQCSFEGPVPASIGGLQKLQHLSLAWNQLTGGFPSLPNLPALQEMHLSGNRLGGMKREHCMWRLMCGLACMVAAAAAGSLLHAWHMLAVQGGLVYLKCGETRCDW